MHSLYLHSLYLRSLYLRSLYYLLVCIIYVKLIYNKELSRYNILYMSTSVLTRKKRERNSSQTSIYSKILTTKTVHLDIKYIGTNLVQTLEKNVAEEVEGKCSVEGLIKPNSLKILTYSSGLINSGYVSFEVVFECLVCCPVEGMLIQCEAKNITKAGIRAVSPESPSPIMVFVARDHHIKSQYYSTVKENSLITVRVIGQRFELNDSYISIIAELIEPREKKLVMKKQIKLNISKK